MNVYKQRVLNIAKACREARAAFFDMSIVISECGAPGCAWGNYAARGDLQSEFSVKFTDYRTSSTLHLPSGEHITFRDEPVLNHLGITISEALELFNTDGCGEAGRNPLKAAAYIKAFAERKWPEPTHTDAELVSALITRVTSGERIAEDA